jgi:hypothetical protein
MFQVLAGRARVAEIDYPDITWDTGFLPAEYVLSEANKAYGRSGVNAGNNALRNFIFADKELRMDELGDAYGYYWEIDLTGSSIMDGYTGVIDISTAEDNFDQDVDPLTDAVMYRGDGSTWVDGVQVAGGFDTYGDGKTLMMAFDPVDGALWTGVDGSWDREPWVDHPAGYAPGAGAGGLFVLAAQARAAIDAGVLKAEPDTFTYPVPDKLIPLADRNTNPIIRPMFWEFPSTSDLVYSTPFDRSPTFNSANGLFNNRNALTVRSIGGVSGTGVPTAGYYFELYMSPVFSSGLDECSAGFLPSSQWGVNVVPETLQWRADGRFYFNNVQQFPRPPEWNNTDPTGTRLMFCFNPHTGSLWLGQDGVWIDDPEVDSPTFSYAIALTTEWKVCVHHRGAGIPFITKGATIYTLPTEFQYEMPSNAIPLARVV